MSDVALLLTFLYMSTALSGCKDCKIGAYPDDEVERMEKEGIDTMDALDDFYVRVKRITCHNADDGFQGSHEEVSIRIMCGEVEGFYYREFETGESEVAKGITDRKCFEGEVGGLEVKCKHGQNVNIEMIEDDVLSSDETGGVNIPWSFIQYAFHGQTVSAAVTLKQTGSWDRFWNGVGNIVGGICITDLIPGVKALKVSKRTMKKLKRTVHTANDLLEMWGAKTCINIGGNGLGGTYEITVQFVGRSSKSIPSWIILLIIIAFVLN